MRAFRFVMTAALMAAMLPLLLIHEVAQGGLVAQVETCEVGGFILGDTTWTPTVNTL